MELANRSTISYTKLLIARVAFRGTSSACWWAVLKPARGVKFASTDDTRLSLVRFRRRLFGLRVFEVSICVLGRLYLLRLPGIMKYFGSFDARQYKGHTTTHGLHNSKPTLRNPT